MCASCHGGSGEGGVGYPFTGGEVLKTFPHIEDQLRFVYYGSEQYPAAGVDIYGDPDREGGPHVVLARNGAAMPAWGGNLTDAEILGVVCHERYDLGGGDSAGVNGRPSSASGAPKTPRSSPTSKPAATSARSSERFPDIIPIGEAPVPGSPAGE